MLNLCLEVDFLVFTAESKFYGQLILACHNFHSLVYTEAAASNNITNRKYYREELMGQLIPKLQEISNFVTRCNAIIVNFIHQLSAVLNPKTSPSVYNDIFKHINLTQIFGSISKLLQVFITLDSVIQSNEMLHQYWHLYKPIVSQAARQQSQSTCVSNSEQLHQFEKLLVHLDRHLLSGNIFLNCVRQDFEDFSDERYAGLADQLEVRLNTLLLAEMQICQKSLVDALLTPNAEGGGEDGRTSLVGYFGLYVLYRALLPNKVAPDAKHYKALASIQTYVTLADKILWFPAEFLLKYAPLEIKAVPSFSLEKSKTEVAKRCDKEFEGRAVYLVAEATQWSVQLPRSLRSLGSTLADLARLSASEVKERVEKFSKMLLRGLGLARRTTTLVLDLLVVHCAVQAPLSRASLNSIGTLISTSKQLQATAAASQRRLNECIAFCCRLESLTALEMLTTVRARSECSTETTGRTVATSLLALETMLHEAVHWSPAHQTTATFLITLASISQPLLSEKETGRLRAIFSNLFQLSTWASELQMGSSWSFLFHNTELLGPLLSSSAVSSSAHSGLGLRLVLAAFNDCLSLAESLESVCETAKGPASGYTPLGRAVYRNMLLDIVRREIVSPLCQTIEVDLRLQVHSTLVHAAKEESTTTASAAPDNTPLARFLRIPPLNVAGGLLDIAAEVTDYLNATFYNLTTVALHDGALYSHMRSVADFKYGLKLAEYRLPLGSLNQSVDMLVIMRDMQNFVSRFVYDMNCQQFIEVRPEQTSKHLRTVTIPSFTASLRQHGLGVVHTAVDSAYQFLTAKFNQLSALLSNDYVRSTLRREHIWYRKHRLEAKSYPVERAFKVLSDLSQQPGMEAGNGNAAGAGEGLQTQRTTCVEDLRRLVTAIGNAVGYVRMVRSANMRLCSDAVEFLPVIDSPEPLSGLLHEQTGGCSADRKAAVEHYDAVVSDILRGFGESSDFLNMLADVFRTSLLVQGSEHLGLLYAAVPALSVSFIESLILARGRLSKTGPKAALIDAYHIDDGFAVGMACCLSTLQQRRKFNSLHWFDAYAGHLTRSLEEAVKDRAARDGQRPSSQRRGFGLASLLASFSGTGGGAKGGSDRDAGPDSLVEEAGPLTGAASVGRLETTLVEATQLSYTLRAACLLFKHSAEAERD